MEGLRVQERVGCLFLHIIMVTVGRGAASPVSPAVVTPKNWVKEWKSSRRQITRHSRPGHFYTSSEESFYADMDGQSWKLQYCGSAVTLMTKALGNDERRAAE